MRAILDTCVVIDALQEREPFREDAEQRRKRLDDFEDRFLK